jgi:4-hydroxy-tetrahydrodipicolinate synthase
MLRFTVAAAAGKPVIAGIERPTTEEVLRHAARAKELGAHGVMLTSPFGGRVEQKAIVNHYQAVHDAVDLDVYIYNESVLSGNETSFETLLAIAELPRVVGIKDSADPPCNSAQITALRARGLAYYTGLEQYLGANELADGCVVSLANLEPEVCKAALGRKDASMSAELKRLIQEHNLFADDWYRHVKKALKARGIIESDAILTEPNSGVN